MDTAFPKFGKVEYFCGGGLTGFSDGAGVLPDGLNWDGREARPAQPPQKPAQENVTTGPAS
ncbi:hypothetical protein FXV83_24355 [Bradyrhizobium hipponense]|uniref:Uncharacterized protein n=1 Tax=Bradyrhizobium hipponense TaxID=2605638 RepID=A0A5S4YJ57_9BRAD|nr:hypothetical protein [Bradyrhizobium hipponense]TYO64042.1 hypothetical protein FXV83_24355 [Bradyrhizobium hipponense]